MDQSPKKDVARSPDLHATSQAGDLPSTAVSGRVASGDKSPKKDVARSPDLHASSQAGDLPSTAASRVQGASGDPSPKKDVAVSQDVRVTPQAPSATPSITAEHIQRAPAVQSPKKEVAKPDLPVTSQAGTAPSTAADSIQGASGNQSGHKKDGAGPPDIPGTKGPSGDQSSKKEDNSRPSDLPGTSQAATAPSTCADCTQGASGDQSSKKEDDSRPSDLPGTSQAATAPSTRADCTQGASGDQSSKKEDDSRPSDLPGTSQAASAPSTCAVCTQEANVDVDDSQMCIPYASDIYGYLRSREVKLRPLANYLEAVQIGITATMRKCLVDWMAQVVECFRLRSDILCLAVSYVDRSLSSFTVIGPRLQLLGASAIYVAWKYAEHKNPRIKNMCRIVHDIYRKDEVLKMEISILRHLRFDMGSPTVKTFLGRFTQAGRDDGKYLYAKLEFLGSYLAELTLMDYGCLWFLPSVVAASAVFVARFTLDPRTHPWSQNLKLCTGYDVIDLKDCIHVIHGLHLTEEASHYLGIRYRYCRDECMCVAWLGPYPQIPATYFDEP